MSGRGEAHAGQVRVQIPAYAWLDALKSSFIADNESWWERREQGRGSVAYVAVLEVEQARMVAHALEGQSKVTWGHQSRWALTRAVLRIDADIKVMDLDSGPEFSKQP